MDVATGFALVVLVVAIVLAVVALVQVSRAAHGRQEAIRARDEARQARDEARAAVTAAREARDTAAAFVEASRSLREETRRAQDEAQAARDETARLTAVLLDADRRPREESTETPRREVSWTVRRMLRPGRYELVNVGTGTARAVSLRGAGEHPDRVRPDDTQPREVPVEDGIGFAAARGSLLSVEWTDTGGVPRTAELTV